MDLKSLHVNKLCNLEMFRPRTLGGDGLLRDENCLFILWLFTCAVRAEFDRKLVVSSYLESKVNKSLIAAHFLRSFVLDSF